MCDAYLILSFFLGSWLVVAFLVYIYMCVCVRVCVYAITRIKDETFDGLTVVLI